jgi:hypothetical protein
MLRAVVRRGLLAPEAAHHRRGWKGGGGFSVKASLRREALERAGLQRRLRPTPVGPGVSAAHATDSLG